MNKKVNSPSSQKVELEAFGFREKEKFFWWASWYAKVLGYSSFRSLRPSIEKARLLCMQLNISVDENFIIGTKGGKQDIKLTKFACFLISFQADGRKPIVKRARSFFLNELEEVNIILTDQDYIERITERSQVSVLNKLLTKTARAAHVKDFRFFANEGYLGLYNHTMSELKQLRGVPNNENMSDYEGLTELAANMFRITLTNERLKKMRNPSEQTAAREHWKIGSQIRNIIKRNTGKYPEELRLRMGLSQLQKKLKQAQIELNSMIDASSTDSQKKIKSNDL